MSARFVAVVMAALLGSVACADVPASDVAPADATAASAEPGGAAQTAQASAGDDATPDTTPSPVAAEGADLPTGSLPPGRPLAPRAEPETLDLAALGVNRGSRDAPVRIVEFSDYGCGYCRRFHQETWPTLQREFVDAGKVEWKFLPYVSGMFKNSPVATLAAECVLEQGDRLFETMNSLVWNGQSEWKGAADAVPVLRGLAGEAGADVGAYDACMEDGRRMRRVDAATDLARELGVRATPTFVVVGYPPIQGALPTETFQQILTMVYEEATRAGVVR